MYVYISSIVSKLKLVTLLELMENKKKILHEKIILKKMKFFTFYYNKLYINIFSIPCYIHYDSLHSLVERTDIHI